MVVPLAVKVLWAEEQAGDPQGVRPYDPQLLALKHFAQLAQALD